MIPPRHPDPGRGGQRGTRVAWVLVFLAGSFTVATSLWQRPNLDTDAGTCLLAAEQLRVGQSDRFHQLVEVNPGKLSEDVRTQITWWPPSYSIPAALVKNAGLDWGRCLQASFLFFWSIGILGWALLFRRLASGQMLPWLLLALILFRYCHHAGYLYEGGELMYWSLFPSIMLLNLVALEQRDGTGYIVFLAGLATPCLVLLKYSAGISALGIGSCWLLMARTRQTSLSNLTCWTAAAVVATAAILLGGQLPHGNPASSSGQWQWATLLWAPGAWTFAMSDLESLVRFLAIQPGRNILPGIGGGVQGGQVALVSPVTLGVVAWLLVCARRTGSPDTAKDTVPTSRQAETVVVVHLLVFTLVLTALIVAGGKIHMDARLLRPASLAVLPLLVMRAAQVIQCGKRMARLSGATFLLLLVILPAIYGAATLIDKSLFRSRSAASKIGPLGIRHDLLAGDGDAIRFYEEVRQAAGKDGRKSILYIIDPGMALPLADQRLLIQHAHLQTVEHLANKKPYTGCPPGGVLLVLPGEFVANGKLAAIEKSFQNVADWHPLPLDSQPGWIMRRGTP